jgi:Arc/MetJ family transcription regulator
MPRARREVSAVNSNKPKSQTRTNIHIDKNLVRRISSRTSLKSSRAIVDFALRTTAELLEKRAHIATAADSVFGLTRNTGIFPQDYATVIRGKN